MRTVWRKEIYSLILCKKISPEGKNVMLNRKRARSEIYMRQMNNNRQKYLDAPLKSQ